MFDIRDYEAMAMLDLQGGEREILREQMDNLRESFAVLEQVDTGHALPLVNVLSTSNVMREDCAEKLFSREEILANAPEQYDGYFQVPGTLG